MWQRRHRKFSRYIGLVMACLIVFSPFLAFAAKDTKSSSGCIRCESEVCRALSGIGFCIMAGSCVYVLVDHNLTPPFHTMLNDAHVYTPVYSMLGKTPEYIDTYANLYHTNARNKDKSAFRGLLLTLAAPIATVLTFSAVASLRK